MTLSQFYPMKKDIAIHVALQLPGGLEAFIKAPKFDNQ
jgi:hypothetical protein